MGSPLTARQESFVLQYLVDLNATQAATRAGYSARTAGAAGARLLKNVKIQDALRIAQQARAARTEITQDYVLGGLREVAQRCLQRVPVMRFDREAREMVQVTDEDGEGVWQFDSGGANRSLELLGKHLGLFVDRTELSGPRGGEIPVGPPRISLDSLPLELVRQLRDHLKGSLGG